MLSLSFISFRISLQIYLVDPKGGESLCLYLFLLPTMHAFLVFQRHSLNFSLIHGLATVIITLVKFASLSVLIRKGTTLVQ